MWRVAVFVVVLLVSPSLSGAQFNEIDDVLRSAVDDGQVPGVVGLIVTRDGVVYERAFGMQDVGAGRRMETDAIFNIASMTKAITSVAVMQLVDDGLVALDDPAAQHVPVLGSANVLTGFDTETGEPLLRSPARPVTVRHLLTHTSGFGYEIWNEHVLRLVSTGALESLFADSDGLLAAPLLFDPGDRWEYGISTDWLGRLVEEVSGQTLDAYFRERIFDPLGMSDTHYNVPPGKVARLVTAHERDPDGALVERPGEAPSTVTVFGGGGGLRSTAADYARFLGMLLNEGALDGRRVLETDTVRMMAENHIGDLEAGAMTTVMPPFSNDFDFFPESQDKFGLGFLLNGETVAGGRSTGSLAWAGLGNTYFWVDPTQGVAGVLLMQILPFYDQPAVELLGRFERAVYSTLESR